MPILAVVGPPHSGKSVFLAELFRQLLKCSNRVFLQRACPDGEGMWSSEADPAIVHSIRRKGQFSEEFISVTLSAIEQLGQNPQFKIVLLDLGGKRTAENAEILQRSDFLILLSSNLAEIPLWQQFAANEDCKTLAILESRLKKTDPPRSILDLTQLPIRGVLWNLERTGILTTTEAAIAQLAEWLIERFDQPRSFN